MTLIIPITSIAQVTWLQSFFTIFLGMYYVSVDVLNFPIGCGVELTSTAREVISRPGITANKVSSYDIFMNDKIILLNS